MKLKLLIATMFLSQFLSAQIFTEHPLTPPIQGFKLGDSAMADVDGDGDEDLITIGSNPMNLPETILYLNDGAGNFSEKLDTPFPDLTNSAVAFADIDGDQDQDLFMTGMGAITPKFYLNDGQGNFSEMLNSSFPLIGYGSATFEDVDGDDDKDLFIVGSEISIFTYISKLFINDGDGNFTEKLDTPFEGLAESSMAFADIDGDNDLDLLLTGSMPQENKVSKLYINDGQGNFDEVLDSPFFGVSKASIEFSDVDEDGDQDVIILGIDVDYRKIPRIYNNDGSGNFTLVTGTPFEAITTKVATFLDVDGDGDEDYLTTVVDTSDMDVYHSKIYFNTGQGNFSDPIDAPFEVNATITITSSDLDNDGDIDLFVTEDSYFGEYATTYFNDGQGNFTESCICLDPSSHSSFAFSDIDGDGDNDLLMTGYISFIPFTELYINDGLGNFNKVLDSPFIDVARGSMAFVDIDGDEDQDVFITGFNYFEKVAVLYENDGQGNFTEVTDTPFEGVGYSAIAFSDVDGDNFQDLMLTGFTSANERVSKLYLNDGLGNFTEELSSSFIGVTHGSIAFSDVDGDGDNDLLITGRSEESDRSAILYLNDGQSNFTEVEDTPFHDVNESSVAFADIDGDLDEDLIINGNPIFGADYTVLYTNDGLGNFTEVEGPQFPYTVEGAVAFSDVDGDNDMDLMFSGNPTETVLYLNDGGGNFVENQSFLGLKNSAVGFSDVNGDNQVDFLLTGYDDDNARLKIFLNQSSITNTTENHLIPQLTVIPNPFQKTTIFKIKEIPGDHGNLNIFDANGVLVFSQSVTSNTDISFSKDGLASGIYFYEVVDQKKVRLYGGKVIKY